MKGYVEPEISVDVAAEEVTALTADMKEQVDPMGSGFTWYQPPTVRPGRSHETCQGTDWSIAGHDMQVLMMTMPQNGTVVTEVGSYMFSSPDINMDVDLTLCKGGEGCRRMCGGESCVKLLVNNNGSAPGYIGLTPAFPAKVIPIQFGKQIDANHKLIAQGGSYMVHIGDVDVDCDLDCQPTICCCAGFGACRQMLKGTDGSIAFLAAGGTVVYRKLEAGEQVMVDTRSVVAMEESVNLGVMWNGYCTCCCGGESCYSATLTGPGKVFLQSMNFFKFQEAVTVTIIDDRGAGTTTVS